MTTTFQTPTTPAAAKVTLRDPGTAPHFERAYMALNAIGYEKDHSVIPSAVAAPGMAPNWQGGHWTCAWGPVERDGNLVYVANFISDASAIPVVSVIVVRGTDIQESITHWIGDHHQLDEDLRVTKQVEPAWSVPGDGIRIAEGTAQGLISVNSLKDALGVSVKDYLLTLLNGAVDEWPLIVVTGHSLGGCLASALASDLDFKLNRAFKKTPIVPCTFAGPSAGNAAFAQDYESRFAYCPRYFNTMDTIPHWWDALTTIKTIYPGEPAPVIIDIFIRYFTDKMAENGVAYQQPATCNRPLLGAIELGLSWTDQIEHQHHATTYLTLMQDAGQ